MIEVTKDTIEAFASLFKGRTDAHGQVNECVYEPVTLAHYEKHLRGEVNLGVYFLLDDSTCHFAAVDLDEKNFAQAKAIRDELTKNSILSYIAESKSKGFHIYCFAQDKFQAVEIRRVLHHILNKLNIKIEIFPKQDYHQPDDPDGTKHPGSYINLPCFGYTRPFLSGDMKEVPLEVALERIKRVPQEAIVRVLQTLPKEKSPKGKPTLGEEAESLDDEVAVKKLLDCCAFIQYCQDNAKILPEPFWWSMVHCLAVFGEVGKGKIHELSRPYPGYSKEETNKKIKEALKVIDKEVGPHTCLFIEQGLGFACPEDCQSKKLKIKAPAGLAAVLAVQELRGPYLYRDKSGWHLDIQKLVDDLLSEYTFKTMMDNEECFIYTDGIYAPSGEVTIKQECEKRVPKKFITTHNVNEVIGHIKRSTYANREKFNQGKWILNLKNGLYNIERGELSPHTPKCLSTTRIPVVYNPEADCPRIRLFFLEILREQNIPAIEELFGYCLIPDYTIQRAFLFTGDGANGKSSLLELLKHFIGKDNCTNLSLQALVSHRFSIANLFGKLVNIYADIPSTRMESVGLFKMLTGGDTVRGERKFKDDFFFTNLARLVFSTNKPPWVDEDTLAFWRRWIIIDFPNKFEGDKADPELQEKLTTENELSGLLNITLQELKKLLTRHKYSYNPSPDESAEKYRKSANITFAFTEDMCEPDANAWISKDDLYDTFANYCNKLNLSHPGKESFGRALKNVSNIHVKSLQHRIAGTATWGWDGIRLKKEEINIDMEV